MNEFEVYDNYNKRWLAINECAISLEGKVVLLSHGAIYDVIDDSERFTICKGISKTDIEGNKIYADSSILEYLMTYTDGCKSEIKRGVFTYNKVNSSYDIRNIEALQLTMNAFWVSRASNFKIIGTLQQDKELLNDKSNRTKQTKKIHRNKTST